MTIAVDFDGTIVEHRYPEIGRERPFATQVLKMLIADRHKLVLWTMRKGQLLDDAINWCKERGVEFYAVNTETNDQCGTMERSQNFSQKIHADIFIDDRNIGGLPTWTQIYKIIKTGQSYKDILMDENDNDNNQRKKWWKWK